MTTVILDPTAGITYPDSVLQATAAPDPSTSGNGLISNGTIWQSQSIPSDIPSGTAMLFKQTAAPTGWTKDLTVTNNASFRVVTGAASTGGTVDFTTAFASQAVSGTIGNYGAFTLTTSELPAHTHTLAAGLATSPPGGYLGGSNAINTNTQTTSSTGGGGSHTHTGGTFTGTAINLAVKYVDFIVATKN